MTTVYVTNKWDKPITFSFEYVWYTFPVGETVEVPLEAARHIFGYQHEDKEEGRVIHQERRYGKYVRSIRLGKDVDESNVKANYKDGVLQLELPKVEEVKPRKIDIAVN